jgi:serine/threonine protein kinase
MAPEQFLHHDLDHDKQSTVTYSAKVDIYGFGITCYGILTGKSPFDDMPTNLVSWQAIDQCCHMMLMES